MSFDAHRHRAIADAVAYDDRKELSDLWQEYAPLPDVPLRPAVYDALLAVARWGAGRMYDDRITPSEEGGSS